MASVVISMGIGSKQSMKIKNQNGGEYTFHIYRVKEWRWKRNREYKTQGKKAGSLSRPTTLKNL